MLSIKGKLVKHLPLENGTNKSGKPWQKSGIVIEYGDEYPKKLALDLFGERATMANNIPDGSMVTVNFSVESNEYNGKYITNCRAISIGPAAQQPTTGQQATSFYGQPPQTPASTPSGLPPAGPGWPAY